MAGLKIDIGQLLHIYNLGILKVIPNPSFIFVRRKNVLKQAISMWIATHTKQWAFFQKKKFELPNVLNVDDIFKFVNNIMNKNAAFESFFLISNIKPHRVQYEEFINDPISHVDKISEFLGSYKISYIPSMNKYKKQSTNLNEEIYQKIIENYQLKP